MFVCTWYVISIALITCLFLNGVVGQGIQSGSLDVKGVYRCERMRNGRLHLHFRARDYNSRATELIAVDANNDPLTGVTCSLTPETHSNVTLFVVDTFVDLATKTEVGNSCGMEVVAPNSPVQIYRWRFQARRVEAGGTPIGTKYTLTSECSSDDLDNTFVSTLVPIDVQGMWIVPEESVNKIGNNGVQRGSELYVDGLFYPGQETIPNVDNAYGMFYYDCYAGLDTNNVRVDGERIVDENGCRIPGAAYAPTTEFQTVQQPSANQPQVIRANGMKASEVGLLTVDCKKGFCTEENDVCCTVQKCNCTDPGTLVYTALTHKDDIDVKDELAQDYFITGNLTHPSPLDKKSKGSEGEMVHYVAKLTPGGAGTTSALMSAKGMAVYNCRASTHRNFPPGQTTQYVNDSGCVIPGTDFSPDAEFMFNADLSSANHYYVTSGQATLTLQKKQRIYHKCDTLICTTENHPICTNKLCGATDTTTDVERLGDQGLEWTIDVQASPKLGVDPVDEAHRIDGGIQEGSPLKMAGHYYPGEDDGGLNAVGMFYVDCYSYTNPGFTQNANQYIDSSGCIISGATYAPTSEFMRTSVSGESPVTIEATGATAQYVNGQDDIYFRCRRRYCMTADNPCCTKACDSQCVLATTRSSNDYDSDSILVRNKLAQRLLGTKLLEKPFIPVLTAVEGEDINFVAQLIPGGLNTNADLMEAKGFYVYNCYYSTNQQVPVNDRTLFVNQNGCMVDSDFAAAAEFEYDSILSGPNEYYIRSGLVRLKAQNKYKVYCTCMTGICKTEGHQRCIKRCSPEANAANTNFVELGYQGLNYAISIKKQNRMGIAPERDIDWRGTNRDTVIEDADLQYTGYFYPGEDIHPDAVGYYYHSCYVGTNANAARDRNQFIAANGCPISGAPFSPGNFKRSSTAGDVPLTITASGARAQLLNNRGTIWAPCKIGYCTAVNDPCCEERCGAVCTSNVDTDNIHWGYINVIEAEPTRQLVGSSQISSDPTLTPKLTGIANQDQIYLAAKLVPTGQDSTALIQSAKGFYVYNCRHDNNPNVPENKATYIVDENGCRVPGAPLVPATDFQLNQALSSDYAYILTSGLVTLVDRRGYRTYFKCKTCICLTPNHSYCDTRCGAQGSNTDVRCLDGDITYNIGIIKQDDPPSALTLTSSDGSADLVSQGAVVGESANFGAAVIPSQTTGVLRNAKGAFVTSCFATTYVPSSGNVEDIPESERDYFIDGDGCRIPESDFATNKECTGNVDAQPYEIDCGQYIVKKPGEWKNHCIAGFCNETNDIFCEQRCRPGLVVPGSVRTTGEYISGGFTATEPATTPGRTAIVSEEKRLLIIALTTVIPCAIILGIALGACLLIRSQRRKM